MEEIQYTSMVVSILNLRLRIYNFQQMFSCFLPTALTRYWRSFSCLTCKMAPAKYTVQSSIQVQPGVQSPYANEPSIGSAWNRSSNIWRRKDIMQQVLFQSVCQHHTPCLYTPVLWWQINAVQLNPQGHQRCRSNALPLNTDRPYCIEFTQSFILIEA